MANHKCTNCLHFQGYYTKGYCTFTRTGCGKCDKKQEVVQKSDGCEKWHSRFSTVKIKRKTIIETMGDTVAKIDAIYQYMLEEE